MSRAPPVSVLTDVPAFALTGPLNGVGEGRVPTAQQSADKNTPKRVTKWQINSGDDGGDVVHFTPRSWLAKKRLMLKVGRFQLLGESRNPVVLPVYIKSYDFVRLCLYIQVH